MNAKRDNLVSRISALNGHIRSLEEMQPSDETNAEFRDKMLEVARSERDHLCAEFRAKVVALRG